MANRCDKCKNRIVMHAFSNGNCTLCNDEITCVDTPCDKVCQNCSLLNNLCQVCGEEIK